MTSAPEHPKEQVIVSFTTWPEAAQYAVSTVKSILAGSVLPDKIVLYLTTSQFKDKEIPEDLTKLASENPLFEIRFCDKEIKSYTKLIPALEDFPEDIIVTVDDDVLYHKNMLKELLAAHAKMPDVIVAHRAKRIKAGKPYRQWKKLRWYHFLLNKIFNFVYVGYGYLQTGVGGVLYPPHALREDMLDEKTFTKIAPTMDDIWFWAAAVGQGTKVAQIPFGHNKPKGAGKPKTIALKTINFKSGTDRNAAALQDIFEHYPEIKERLENEK